MQSDRLRLGSLLYLAAPWFLFLFHWLRWPLAVLTLFAFTTALAFSLRGLDWKAMTAPENRRELGTALGIFIVAVIWTAFSGIGGWGFQNIDHLKHVAIVHDLMKVDWPVAYPESGAESEGSIPLVYYLAFHLPAAALGRLFGWEVAQHSLRLWTLLGLYLSLRWFALGARRAPVLAAFAFLFFGGWDLLGAWLVDKKIPGWNEHWEWWAHFAAYPGNSASVFFAPQHAIPAWISIGAIWNRSRPRSLGDDGFLIGSTLLWSPLVTLGLLPFAVLKIARDGVRSACNVANLVLIPLFCAPVAFYFASNRFSFPVYPIWQELGVGTLFFLVVFCAIEFLPYALLVKRLIPRTALDVFEWRAVIGVLAAAPLFKLGMWNDFPMRTTLPAFFLFWQVVWQAIESRAPAGMRLARASLGAAAILGGLGASSDFTRSWESYATTIPTRPHANSGINTLEKIENNECSLQYLGKQSSFYRSWIAPNEYGEWSARL